MGAGVQAARLDPRLSPGAHRPHAARPEARAEAPRQGGDRVVASLTRLSSLFARADTSVAPVASVRAPPAARPAGRRFVPGPPPPPPPPLPPRRRGGAPPPPPPPPPR